MNKTRLEWYQLRDALERADFPSAFLLLRNAPSLIDERNSIGESVLHFLAVENNSTAVEWLHACGADLNAANEFGTPVLFEVALLGHWDLFKWLIKHGADLQKKDAQGQTIAEYLIEFGRPETLEFINKYVMAEA